MSKTEDLLEQELEQELRDALHNLSHTLTASPQNAEALARAKSRHSLARDRLLDFLVAPKRRDVLKLLNELKNAWRRVLDGGKVGAAVCKQAQFVRDELVEETDINEAFEKCNDAQFLLKLWLDSNKYMQQDKTVSQQIDAWTEFKKDRDKWLNALIEARKDIKRKEKRIRKRMRNGD
jgi:hypothetical protein